VLGRGMRGGIAVDPSLEEVSGSEVGMVEIGFIGTCGRMEPRTRGPTAKDFPIVTAGASPRPGAGGGSFKFVRAKRLMAAPARPREPRHRLSSAWNGDCGLAEGYGGCLRKGVRCVGVAAVSLAKRHLQDFARCRAWRLVPWAIWLAATEAVGDDERLRGGGADCREEFEFADGLGD